MHHLTFRRTESTKPPGAPPYRMTPRITAKATTTLWTKVRRTERSRTPPNTPAGYLREMPALIMLDRLAIPMLAVRLDGVVFYTNPAFAAMLGHQPDTVALIGQRLPELMAGHSATTPRDCVTALHAAGTVVVDWLHAEGFRCAA